MREIVKSGLITPCPNLGTNGDEYTSFAYPSAGNICYNCKIPTSPAEAFQKTSCLTTAYRGCVVFGQGKSMPFPRDLLAPSEKIGSMARLKKWLQWGLPGLILMGILGYFFVRYLNMDRSNLALSLLQQFANVASSPSKTASPTSTSAQSIDVAQNQLITGTLSQTFTSTLTYTSTPIPTPTRTSKPRPTLTPTPRSHSLETPIKVKDRQFIIHLVKSGESYGLIAQMNNTTVEVLQAINYQSFSPLWAESAIVIVPGLIVDDPEIPAFQVDQVYENSTNIASLAKKYNVDATMMNLYNNCPNDCTLVSGDWILIPHPR